MKLTAASPAAASLLGRNRPYRHFRTSYCDPQQHASTLAVAILAATISLPDHGRKKDVHGKLPSSYSHTDGDGCPCFQTLSSGRSLQD
ncbi:hypothetical protein BO94DRAFT_7418 [Aspergillus sclerotioniger CBS 115572]|uniref:Uncharacterized protein n=1 Tax=Aspergillus sclerotioniger CBS 115572 TaxID=1450535 RepID=A0A317XCL7_9EURO|nr:hypothetical protein BO94DRAFT_7418 [Aspergillus sclerotioniger CBS 115572]PWY96364.1 hypothetical protein BO94DRAFT_7418 [Aspergillus sclerotioniger CBS 115572]